MKERDGALNYDECVYMYSDPVGENSVLCGTTEKHYKCDGVEEPLKCNATIDSYWLAGPTYASNEWNRYTDVDRPFGYAWFTAGAQPWNELNDMWEGTPKGWIAPLNMANWPD